MPITYKVGDATHPEGEGHKFIVHCCNDQGAWGAGFVLALDKRWSEPRVNYNLSTYKRGVELGTVDFVAVEADITVCNLIGQHGTRGARISPPVRYDAIWRGLRTINNVVMHIGEEASLHMPMMGAGLAGGAWPIIEAIIEDRCPDIPVTVYVLSRADLLKWAQPTPMAGDPCPTCGKPLQLDKGEGMLFCENDWQHG